MSSSKIFAALALALCLLWAGCASKPRPRPLSSVEVSALAEPAVFKVVELGAYQLHDVRFLANTLTLAGIADSPNCWAQIAQSPAQYLNVALKSDQLYTVRRVFATGSSVAVASSGVFLTNAHVVAPPDTHALGELLPGMMGVAGLLVTGLQARPPTALALALRLAGAPGCRVPIDPGIREGVEVKLAAWMISRGVMTSAKLGAVYVVTRPRQIQWPWPLAPRLDFASFGLKPLTGSLAELLRPLVMPPIEYHDPSEIAVSLPGPSDTPGTYATEAEILAQGAPFPGEDVAVLRTKQPLELICLPLGDSDAGGLPDGSEVAAFGFPGAAEMSEIVQDQAHPRVIRHDGKVVNRVRIGQNWEALYVTAAVSEGDSGGPVVDRFGRVVGLNDAGNPRRAENNVAVPVNLAKKYLGQAKVQADPGKLTDHWAKGQEYLQRQDYGKALAEFEIVNGTRPDDDAAHAPSLLDRISGRKPPGGLPRLGPGNDYVERAIQICKQALGQH